MQKLSVVYRCVHTQHACVWCASGHMYNVNCIQNFLGLCMCSRWSGWMHSQHSSIKLNVQLSVWMLQYTLNVHPMYNERLLLICAAREHMYTNYVSWYTYVHISLYVVLLKTQSTFCLSQAEMYYLKMETPRRL